MPRPPFDDSTADTILQSSDGFDFHVHHAVIALASPFFKDLFSLPQPEPKVPVIPVAESSSILERSSSSRYRNTTSSSLPLFCNGTRKIIRARTQSPYTRSHAATGGQNQPLADSGQTFAIYKNPSLPTALDLSAPSLHLR
ncbi:hypothetical protein C8F04DRAFT_1240206 [Mycena alexandri]|uniref:BTB domain-containing protein n=1 Tax=Mycena alexandri TaxID=1745969 RepID=A0AAD6S9G5_9AGAR|nr:hypothetical protein C8F04DRAFT_1240206 [Mycena alexandri]